MPQLNKQANDDFLKSLLQKAQSLSSPVGAYEKGAMKALEEAGAAHTMEAISAGVPSEHIEGQLLNNKIGLLQNLLSTQYGQSQQGQVAEQPQLSATQQPQAQPQSPAQPQANKQIPFTVQQPKNLFESLLGRAQINQNPDGSITFKPAGALQGYDANTAALQQAGAIQELSGKKPMQEGDSIKLATEMAQKQYELAVKQSQEGNLKPANIFDKFEAASQPFITARDAHARLEEAAKDPSAAGDLALLYNYMKVLDPGSTVRESEFATAAASGSIPAQIRGAWEKVMSGKRLDDAIRTDFLDRSRRLFRGMEVQQKKTTEQFRGLAKKNGINFENVVRDTGIVQEQTPSTSQQYKEGQTATNPKTGEKLTFRGGKWQ